MVWLSLSINFEIWGWVVSEKRVAVSQKHNFDWCQAVSRPAGALLGTIGALHDLVLSSSFLLKSHSYSNRTSVQSRNSIRIVSS